MFPAHRTSWELHGELHQIFVMNRCKASFLVEQNLPAGMAGMPLGGRKEYGNGEPGGTRTRDPLIKSQMLYRLSYRLTRNDFILKSLAGVNPFLVFYLPTLRQKGF